MRKILIIGYVWPEPDSSAAGARMLQLIEFFRAQRYQVTFASTAAETQFMMDLAPLNVQVAKIQLNNSSFDNFLKALQPEIVVFDRFMMEEQFGWRVREICPGALRILDTEDLHFYRKARQERPGEQQPLGVQHLVSDLTLREIASVYRCDLSLIISEAELQLLTEQFQVPEHLLLYLPFMEEGLTEEQKKQLPGFDVRTDFVSIGNFRHAPNWDAVLNLKKEVWPRIREKLPQAVLRVYGAYAGPKVYTLHNSKEGFLIEGRARSAQEVLKSHRVLLAPLRFGAGLKGKFIDSMKAGTPAVTTPTGAEGMSGDKTWPGKLATGHEQFAQAAIELYLDKTTWEAKQQLGFGLLEERFSKARFTGVFKERLAALLSDLTHFRSRNFTGSLLHHHQMSSTKYLSKYIEMKNRLESERAETKDRPKNFERSNPNK